MAGFPHSDIPGSKSVCRLPEAFRRLQRPSSPSAAKASTECACSLDHTTEATLFKPATLDCCETQQRRRRARARALGNMVGERSPDFTRGRNDPRRTTTTRRTCRRADALFNFKLVSIPRKSAHLEPPGRCPTNKTLKRETLGFIKMDFVKTGEEAEIQAHGSRHALGFRLTRQPGSASFGGAEEARTPDPLRARQVLSQLSYGPKGTPVVLVHRPAPV